MEKETEEKKIFILHLQTENISNHIENIYQVSLKIIFSLKYIISFFFYKYDYCLLFNFIMNFRNS